MNLFRFVWGRGEGLEAEKEDEDEGTRLQLFGIKIPLLA
jgi:hypothetical protein